MLTGKCRRHKNEMVEWANSYLEDNLSGWEESLETTQVTLCGVGFGSKCEYTFSPQLGKTMKILKGSYAAREIIGLSWSYQQH